MTLDKTPSEALAQLRHLYANLTNGGVRDTASAKRIAEGLLSPAIAALEKWGSPVVATKVTIPTSTMEQEFQNHYRRGFEAGKKAGSPVVAGEPDRYMDDRGYTVTKEWLDSDDATSDYRAAYTTPVYLTPQPTQAQAGAVPLTDEQIGSMACVYGLTNIEVPALQWLVREVEYLHGIKEGGQHAAD